MDHKHSIEDQLAEENTDVTGRYSSFPKYVVTCKAKDFYTPIKNVVKVNYTDSIKTVLSVCLLFLFSLGFNTWLGFICL